MNYQINDKIILANYRIYKKNILYIMRIYLDAIYKNNFSYLKNADLNLN